MSQLEKLKALGLMYLGAPELWAALILTVLYLAWPPFHGFVAYLNGIPNIIYVINSLIVSVICYLSARHIFIKHAEVFNAWDGAWLLKSGIYFTLILCIISLITAIGLTFAKTHTPFLVMVTQIPMLISFVLHLLAVAKFQRLIKRYCCQL